MAADEVELVRRAIDAFNSGDLEASFDALDDDIEWIPKEDWPGRASFHGHDGVREIYGLLNDVFEEVRIEADEFVEFPGKVLVIGGLAARGRSSRAATRSPRYWLFTMRGGRIVRQETFNARAEAVEAAEHGDAAL